MSVALIAREVGPQVTVQDLGRGGLLAVGLSRGGAADRLALLEGAALLGQPPDCAALEMAGMGGVFEATGPCRIALTGAPMRAEIGGRAVVWNASHALPEGERLRLGPTTRGTYGYLSVGGGIETPAIMGSRSAHLVAGIGHRIEAGARLPVGKDRAAVAAPKAIDVEDRFGGGVARVVAGAQTEMFAVEERERFEETQFVRDTRGNRQGVRLSFDGAPFGTAGGRTILSEVIVPGDIQMTGEGTPYVLLPECQTTGGYPRIGSVIPADLPLVAQAVPGAPLRFRFIAYDEAVATYRTEEQLYEGLRKLVRPLLRDPREMADLLSYQLISGVTAGTEIEYEEGS